jgi:hypothetical protein
MPKKKVEKGVWKGCGHKVRAVILDNNLLSIASYMEFEENNPKDLCIDCWEKDTNQ